MASKTVFRVISPEKFAGFLKRFSGIESTLLVEVAEGEMKAKSFTPERAVVKFSKIGLNEAFDHISGDENLCFGIYNIGQFTGAFKHFNDSFEIVIHHDNLDDKNIASKIEFKSDSGKLKITLDCVSYRLFTHITDELFLTKIAGIDNILAEFSFDRDTNSKISSLSSIDSDDKIIGFETSDTGVNAKAASFEMEVATGKFGKFSINVYKSHFNLVDKEDVDLVIGEGKLVCTSKDGNTITVVGETQGDD